MKKMWLAYYMVVIVLASGLTACSSGDSGGLLSAPPPPTGVKAVGENGQVIISWDAVSGAKSYNIYWKVDEWYPDKYSNSITSVKSPYTHTGLTNGQVYSYIVTAVNDSGESSESEVARVVCGGTFGAPTGVVATAGDGQITISWNSVDYADGYHVYRSTTAGVTTDEGYQESTWKTSYTETGLTNGTTYYYIVTAVHNDSVWLESDESKEVSATPKAGATAPLTKDATEVMEASATLNGNINNPAGYTTNTWFEYGTTTSYGNSTVVNAYATTGDIVTSATVTGLQANTTYHYRTVTSNSAGYFWGNDKTFTTYPAPQVLASGLSSPSDIAVDSIHVYWTENSTLKKVSINGGTVTTLASGLYYPSDIIVDTANVYWAENGAIKKISNTGGTVTTLATVYNTRGRIAVDATSVYWTAYSSDGACGIQQTCSGSVNKVSINGGTVTTLASLNGSSGLAVDATSVYWADGSVKKISVDGGIVTTLASGKAYGILIDSTNVYWAESSAINKVSINGGTVTSLATSGCGYLVAMDSSSFYCTNNGGAINKINKESGTVTTLYPKKDSGTVTIIYLKGASAAVDSTSVYWADSSAGTVKKLPK